MAADNLKASKEQLAEAVSGPMQSRHRRVLAMQREELDLLDKHIAELSRQLGRERRRVQEQPVAEGEPTIHRVLNQVAWSAARTKDGFFRELYHRLIPRLGGHKAICAIAHRMAKMVWKILHDNVRYIERGPLALDAAAMKRRVTKLARQMRRLGYTIEVKPFAVATT